MADLASPALIEAGELSPAKNDTLALALLRAEVERHPENINLRFRLAREQLSLGLFEEAERSLETAPSGAATGSTRSSGPSAISLLRIAMHRR